MRNWSMPFLISICIVVFVVSDDVSDMWRNVLLGQLPLTELFKNHTQDKNCTSIIKHILSLNDNKTSDMIRYIFPISKSIISPSFTVFKKPCPPNQKRNRLGDCKEVLKYPYVN
ncbi:uncharacterized protein LOC122538696 isoform X2 [Frieseomelitta varia]|uniref:uncharacterized protein LOC122538696 isoform X2 n=1 Tax=Frieseomelitta varia TaxID=561572 RepID=UPI001CB69CD8|nr:uncharacterized protein LOC122538696 isoform X2 [Frieseomelitta varia]